MLIRGESPERAIFTFERAAARSRWFEDAAHARRTRAEAHDTAPARACADTLRRDGQVCHVAAWHLLGAITATRYLVHAIVHF